MITNLEKMNELVNSNVAKDIIAHWAYMNRIHICDLEYEEEFQSMKNSIDHFIEKHQYPAIDDEHVAWSLFLDEEYID